MGEKKGPIGKRHIVGVIVFDGEKFLLLHRVWHWKGWEFPKGEIEENEDVKAAVARELFEETGLKKFDLIGFVNRVEFFDKIRKADSFAENYLIRVSSNSRVSFGHQPVEGGEKLVEHDGFKWCLPEEAVKLLTHFDTKDSMRKAIGMLGIELGKK